MKILFEWRAQFSKHWGYDSDKQSLYDRFEREVIRPILDYQLPVITLTAETPKEAVCQVFEKVNTGGVSLTVFELLTATYAADDFDLRADWQQCEERLQRHPALSSIDSTIFLQAVTLLSTYRSTGGKSANCRRRDILDLSVTAYQTYAREIVHGFERVAALLTSQKIFSDRDLPYRTQLTPFAAIMAVLGTPNDTHRQKLVRWYWSGVLGQLYGSAIETRFARDLPEVIQWINGGEEPLTVVEATFSPDRLYTMKTRNSAAYKGVAALLMRDGAEDFLTGAAITEQFYSETPVDIHHIFPKVWCEQRQIDARRYDCIINKTLITARTNRMIGGRNPSAYLQLIERELALAQDSSRLDDILSTHSIEASFLRSDDFDAFFEARKNELLRRIERVLGKRLVHQEAIDLSVEDVIIGEDTQ